MKVWNANLMIRLGGLEIGYSISNIQSCISLKRSGKAKAIDLGWVSFSACTPPWAMHSVWILVVMRSNVGEIETGAVTPGRPIWSSPPSELMITKLSTHPSHRDFDQDENNTTHCANATFVTSGFRPTRWNLQRFWEGRLSGGSIWRRGGWWHAGF